MIKDRIEIFISGEKVTIGRFKEAKAPKFRQDKTKEMEFHYIRPMGKFSTIQIPCYNPDEYIEIPLIDGIHEIGNPSDRVRLYFYDIEGKPLKDIIPIQIKQKLDVLESENRDLKISLSNASRNNKSLLDNYEKRLKVALEQMKEIRGSTFIPGMSQDTNE